MNDIRTIALRHRQDPLRLLDMLRDIQAARGVVSSADAAELGRLVGLSTVDILGVASFYHFFSSTPAGRYTVFLNSSITSHMMGRATVARAFEEAAGCRFGETTADGLIGLRDTSCIGMNDQEPAAIINGVVFTRLTPAKVRRLVLGMRAGRPVQDLVTEYGDGANQSELVRAMVTNNIRKKGPVLFAPFESGEALRKAAAATPDAIIQETKKANLLGRGGAGFPTGLKWEFCRREKQARRFVVCNADEGEPGTFKDRVILTELPRLLFEGMAIAGYAIGAEEGILFLRAEYDYLRPHLESVLQALRQEKLLGRAIAGREGFNFDVTIRSGAGAYICGEESGLLEAAEGKRGQPRNRPPFPVQKGYLGDPTTVNNVETLCAAAQIIAHGAAWFRSMGTAKSAGTKLLSVSGDCERPGIYEVEFGLTIQELVDMAGAKDAYAVQVGGPSGNCVGRPSFGRRIAFEDLPTGGSIMIFGPWRDLLGIVENFMEFFVEESCGLCTPCRVGNVLLAEKLAKVRDGHGAARDLEELESWGRTIKAMSQCGLGQTSPNPILTTLQNFRDHYERLLHKDRDFVPAFDLTAATLEGAVLTKRPPVLEETAHE
jgi:[NiFe] hydrogenase diaphorase moiety large subunit